MLDITIFTFIILMLPYPIIFLLLYKQKISALKHITVFAIYLYSIFIVSKTLLPLPFDETSKEIFRQYPIYNNYVPFKTIFNIFQDGNLHNIILQIIGNIILLLPIGFLMPIISKRNNFLNIIFKGLLCSILIESLQGIISLAIGVTYRTIDIDDIILNTIGVFIGYVFYKLIKKYNPQLF